MIVLCWYEIYSEVRTYYSFYTLLFLAGPLLSLAAHS